jgi:hypothetical protein
VDPLEAHTDTPGLDSRAAFRVFIFVRTGFRHARVRHRPQQLTDDGPGLTAARLLQRHIIDAVLTVLMALENEQV